MSNTTNDGTPEATELAFVEDAEGLSQQTAPDAEGAKALEPADRRLWRRQVRRVPIADQGRDSGRGS